MNNKLKHELEKIKIPKELHNRAKMGVENAKAELNNSQGVNKRAKNGWFSKKATYVCTAVVLFVGLFIASAFVSPVMAKMASKLPYLGQIFESDLVVSDIAEELEKMDYPISGVGVSYQDGKEISIRIKGSEEYFNEIKEEVEKTAYHILGSRNYDAYTVKVSRAEVNEEFMKMSEKDQKRLEENEFLHKKINDELENQGYDILTLSITNNKFDRGILVEVPDTESEAQLDKIEALISNVVKTNDIETYPVEIKKVDLEKREQEARWANILHLVGEDLLGKKVYKITGLAYSVHPAPEIIFKSSVKSTDPDAKEYGEEMEKVIEDFLNSEEMKDKVKGDSYTITIRSKDQKKLN
ncbi:DUF4030 domain-containing protein [Pseudalkalibacillus sp. A8]|uniref:DUF4030 domain-containing protein n=1 Tax=Pseudalkalibacillus sp. A8 TaxID=3382641 RepID=UPI0038B422BD